MDAAGNAPRARGLGGELRNFKQQRPGQAPGGFPDMDVAGNAPRARGLGGELRNFNKGEAYEKICDGT